jgi:FSR family fosmidomycin resistance protein-like MFS transporter
MALVFVASPIIAAMSGVVLLPRTFLAAALFIVLGKIGNALFHPPAIRVIAASDTSRHGLLMSIFAFGGNAGVAIGPLLILALIGAAGPRGGLIAVIPAVFVAAFIYHSSISGVLRRAEPVRLDERRLSGLFNTPFILLVVVMALRAGVWSALTTFVPIFFVREGASVLAGGFALTIFSLSGALLGLFAGALFDWIGRRVIVVGSMVVATAALGLFLTSMGIVRLIWLGVVGAGLLSVTPLGVVMAQEMHPQQRATVSGVMMGTTFGLGTLGIVPVVGHIGDTVSMAAGLWVLVGVSFLASLLAIFLPEKAVG